GFIVDSYELDFRVGGNETGAFRVDTEGFRSDEIRNDTYFFDIVEDERIVYGYSMANVGVPFSASLSTVLLERDDDGGTKLTFHEQVAFFDRADGVKMRETGTRQLLERLAEELGEESVEIDWNPDA
ncbi:MAG TPA: SRPBCC domain-containing protein, partial [Trueperaceae bacterium]|nr:SRPBCC domain-containing protein [Trueperaceae bacterium]